MPRAPEMDLGFEGGGALPVLVLHPCAGHPRAGHPRAGHPRAGTLDRSALEPGAWIYDLRPAAVSAAVFSRERLARGMLSSLSAVYIAMVLAALAALAAPSRPSRSSRLA